MEIEDKLLKFRKTATYHQENSTNNIFNSLKDKFNYFSTSIRNKYFKSNNNLLEKKLDETDSDKNIVNSKSKFNNSVKLRKKNDATNKIVLNEIETDLKEQEPLKYYIIKLILKILLWTTLFAIFIKLEFGIPYFIISLLIIIFLNTNVGRKNSKISAYSVFNPNLERIQGN
jgi:hypothetical protein